MLYDSSRAGNLRVAWFDVRHWQMREAVEGGAIGRGVACFIEADDGAKLVLRPYRRGGLVARVLSRHYVWSGEFDTRPFREWLLTYRMHRAGLPVAAPIAAHYRRQLGMYTGELITERLSVHGTLAECLMTDALSVRTWIAIGRCIRRFHDFGVCHADLNVRNILVGEGGAVYLIDFDRCSLRKPGLWLDSNLVRLRRSLEKVTYGMPRERFTEADWHALLDGYRQGVAKPREHEPAPAAVRAADARASDLTATEAIAEIPEPEVMEEEVPEAAESPTAESGVAGEVFWKASDEPVADGMPADSDSPEAAAEEPAPDTPLAEAVFDVAPAAPGGKSDGSAAAGPSVRPQESAS
jgi:3-deoxy-D-manno-octulosonic acid kinase